MNDQSTEGTLSRENRVGGTQIPPQVKGSPSMGQAEAGMTGVPPSHWIHLYPQEETALSPSGRTRPQVAGQLGPWKVLQSPFGTFHIQVLPSAVPANRTGARGCHSIHWAERKAQ